MDAQLEELTQRNRELGVLNTIAAEFNRSVDLQQILDTVLEQAAYLLGLQTGWIWLLDDAGEPYLAARRHLPPGLIDHPELLEGDCYCLQAYRRGKMEGAANINVMTCSRLKQLVDGTNSLRCHSTIPLFDRDRKIGLLNLASADYRELSPADLRLLHTVGDLLSIAIQRAKASDEIRRQNLALEAANRKIEMATQRKSQFLRRMSHDLRSPMNAIIGYTRLLLRRTADRLDEREQGNLRNIETSSGNLLNLINDILDLSRIEAGHVEVEVQQVDVRTLADECADALGSIVKEGVELRRELDDVGEIKTDPDRLRQVVMNLLGNATKFTDTGSITVSLRSVDVAVELSVADTGVGIPPEDLPHIFDEFRQVERQGGEQTEGTGLGLAIAKKTVDLLGGTLTAESEVGVGTTFTVRIGDYSEPMT